jgi:hypothetical protein
MVAVVERFAQSRERERLLMKGMEDGRQRRGFVDPLARTGTVDLG